MSHYTLGYKTDLISEIRARESTHPDCNLTSPPRKKMFCQLKNTLMLHWYHLQIGNGKLTLEYKF